MLETRDLMLKSGDSSDWEDLYETFWSRAEVFAYLFQNPCQTPEAAERKTAAYAAMHREVPTEFFVYEKASQKAIGIAGLKRMAPGLFTVTDVAIGPDFWGRGYGTQILNALTKLAAVLDAERVLYHCFQQNTPSRCLALSCGFHYIKAEDAGLLKNGDPVQMDHFEKIL